MNITTIVLIVVQGWFECMATAAAGLVSWNIKFKARQLMLIGAVMFIGAQATKLLPIRFGVHTILNMFLLLPLNYFIFKPPFWMASAATFGGFTLFLVAEELVLVYIVRVRMVHIEDITGNVATRTLFGLVSPVVLAIYCGIVLGIRSLLRRRRNGAFKKTDQAV